MKPKATGDRVLPDIDQTLNAALDEQVKKAVHRKPFVSGCEHSTLRCWQAGCLLLPIPGLPVCRRRTGTGRRTRRRTMLGGEHLCGALYRWQRVLGDIAIELATGFTNDTCGVFGFLRGPTSGAKAALIDMRKRMVARLWLHATRVPHIRVVKRDHLVQFVADGQASGPLTLAGLRTCSLRANRSGKI